MLFLIRNYRLLLNKHFFIHLRLSRLILLLLNLLLRKGRLSQRTHCILCLLCCRWLRRMMIALLRRTSVSENRSTTSQSWRCQLHQKLLASSCGSTSNRNMVLSRCNSLWSILSGINEDASSSIVVWLCHQVSGTRRWLLSEICWS
jgi:hypothetical protein